MKKLLLILTIFLLMPFTKVNAEEVSITFFNGNGCPHCAKEEKFLDTLKKQLGENINIQYYETWDNKENNELLTKVRQTLNNKDEGVPFTVVGTKYFEGYNDNIAKEIKQTVLNNFDKKDINITELIKEGKQVPTSQTTSQNPTMHFTLLGETNVKKTSPLAITTTEGIADAINLGSLWIILFLSGIMMAIYSNKKRLLLGGLFILTSTITYMTLTFINTEFTVNQTTFIRTFIAIIAIIVGAITVDAHIKISVPKKSLLQILQELFGKKQMILYASGIIIASIIITFTLVNQTQSSPLLVKTALEINGITNQIPYMLLYFFMYLITSLILVGVLNIIIKELVIENTIGTYNRLIAGIIMLIAAFILIYFPGIFMMA